MKNAVWESIPGGAPGECKDRLGDVICSGEGCKALGGTDSAPAPYNHPAQCGKVNHFSWGTNNDCEISPLDQYP